MKEFNFNIKYTLRDKKQGTLAELIDPVFLF